MIRIKESSGDINRLHLLARDYPHIQLSCGMDDQALEFFAGRAQPDLRRVEFLPEEHVALYETCVLQGDFAKGRRIMSAMLPLMRVLEQGGKFIQCVKHGVETTGLRAGPCARRCAPQRRGKAGTRTGDPHAQDRTVKSIREGN